MFILTEKLYFWFLFHGHKNNSLFTIPILPQVHECVHKHLTNIYKSAESVCLRFQMSFKGPGIFWLGAEWLLRTNDDVLTLRYWGATINQTPLHSNLGCFLQICTDHNCTIIGQRASIGRRICHHGSHGYHFKIIKILEKRAEFDLG